MSKAAWMCTVSFIAAALPSFAYAHAGEVEAGGFLQGLTHPASGLDHLCAMLAVGLWAAQMGGRSAWAVPLTFVGVMALGGALGTLGISLPLVEPGILLSLLMLGVLIAAAVRLPLWLSVGIVGLFALWHGYAHGAGMPASGMGYMLGFVLATSLLHITGIVFGLAVQRLTRQHFVRLAGAGIALFGLYLSAV